MDLLMDGNHTAVTFILLGLTDDPVLRVILFMTILCIYLVTVSGNLTIIIHRTLLHHPMYLFLRNLAFADIGYSSSVTPNMLVNFLVEMKTISYLGCGIQLGSAVFFGTAECFLLAAMAYDHFVAICSPLLYSTKMSTQVCVQLLVVTYTGGFINASSFTFSFFSLLFCGPNAVNHFFCDFTPLVKLSCSDVSISAVVPSFSAGSIIVVTLFVIAVSYIYILITILKMRSTEGHHKAFSTCTSHLTAVTLFYGTTTFTYVMPKSSYSTDQNKAVSVFYMVVIPVLNPLIYSLRNKEIKGALKRELSRKIFSKEQFTEEMEVGNYTTVTDFIILGLTQDPKLCVIFFVIFLGIYIVTLVGNISIITLIRSCSKLHTPMYLFLSHLAFVDIGYSTSVTPVMLIGFLGHGTALPVAGCEAQLCCVVTFGTAECFLLAAMAYDRYVAICSPLLYSTRMSPGVYSLLVGASYLGGCVNAWTFTSCLLNLSFCGPNKIDHFFCDFSPLLKLSCSDISVIEIIPSVSSGSIIGVTVFVIVLSYMYILTTVLKMRSTAGHHKAFSTCTSHLTAVTLYYGTITFIYVLPKSSYSTNQNRVVSLFYTVVIPMLNPLIYSLRNRDVKEALWKTIIKMY
ncbi:LOW QUALITY PROTEIN: uncharacterized protein O8D03_006233 [Erethizon dorsatum]